MNAEPNAPGGFVLLARKTLESDLMQMTPQAFKLFFWMILRANFKDRGISAGAIMPPWSDRIPRLRRSENVPAKAFRSICW